MYTLPTEMNRFRSNKVTASPESPAKSNTFGNAESKLYLMEMNWEPTGFKGIVYEILRLISWSYVYLPIVVRG